MGARWLREWCGRATGGGKAREDDCVALAVCRILLCASSGDEVAAELFELFGDGAFDSIQELVEHRFGFTASPLCSHSFMARKFWPTCAGSTAGAALTIGFYPKGASPTCL